MNRERWKFIDRKGDSERNKIARFDEHFFSYIHIVAINLVFYENRELLIIFFIFYFFVESLHIYNTYMNIAYAYVCILLLAYPPKFVANDKSSLTVQKCTM